MEKPRSSSSSRHNGEIQSCVGKLEIARPKQVGGFLCGSIPVPTDTSLPSFTSALVPSSSQTTTVSAPRYRLLPTETDLNLPPRVSAIPDKLLPLDYAATPSNPGVPWDDGAITCNLAKKGEALAVSGLVEYGDEIDVIAPADILKQIFKMPYSKARLSIAVHRVGQTLVLNAGPDIEEGERLARRSPPKCSDESLFLNFAMHSVRMEACDCPPNHSASVKRQAKSSVLPDVSDSRSTSSRSSDVDLDDVDQKEGHDGHADYSKGNRDGFYWKSKKSKRSNARNPVTKASHIGEKPRCPMQESERYRKGGSDEFLRVLFWQFHNFRMLLGSDLLLFSNEKYVSVSLHLWDVSRQVTPLTWLEAWLDNVMASVPELAICYHQDGVVQGYELLKTDDIFLLKGVSEDGTPAFHPYVVQQNGLSVLRFLQANCKQDPGAYWLYKNAGEDVIQLFDLSVIPPTHPSDDDDGCSSMLPSLIHKGRADSLLSLGTLLYRIGHRLSLSMTPYNRARCARFVKQCLELLDEPHHLVVRAFAHEQYARLILNSDEELDLAAETFPLASEATVIDQEEESFDIVSCISESSIQESCFSDLNSSLDSISVASGEDTVEITVSESKKLIASDIVDLKNSSLLQHHEGDAVYTTASNAASTSADVIQTIADPVSSRLAAVHHVSQAIKSLRWTRQLQGVEPGLVSDGSPTAHGPTRTVNFSVCACGDADCIEVCDIREWLPKSQLDHKLWKLILLLGESYLALGQAYREDGQLLQALKVVEVACSVYGSVPQYLDDAEFVSSMVNNSTCHNGFNSGQEKRRNQINLEHFSSTYLFWAKAWTLVGDVYVDFLAVQSNETSMPSVQTASAQELRMSSEVVKELIRLKKKLGQDVENCSTCSLVNCSCQNDRASSGSSASSSRGETSSLGHGRKSKRSHFRSTSLPSGNPENGSAQIKGELGRKSEITKHKKDNDTTVEARTMSENETKEESDDTTSNVENKVRSSTDTSAETSSGEPPKSRNGGIFNYLRGPGNSQRVDILPMALSCYEAAKNALGEAATDSDELQSLLKKIGWVCNELGRIRLERKDLAKAELAFAKAINAFREVSDHTNIILINCNLGHGRRALAETLVSKMDFFKSDPVLRDAYKQALENAIMEYGKSLRFYAGAKSELRAIGSEADDLISSLRNEVYTQFAHTYLRLGMLLAREDTVANVYVNGAWENNLGDKRTKKEHRKTEVSANDAIREALSIYESLGDLRKQEAAYAYFQLGCYQRDCCLKFLSTSHSNQRNSNQSKYESSILQRAKQYLSLAERNWQKAVEFYGARTHPIMYLTILMERADLLSSLSGPFHSYMMLEIAFSGLLEGRHVSEELHSNPSGKVVLNKFWGLLQMLLKKMLASSLPSGTNKAATASQTTTSSRRSGDAEKLKELYKMSLKSPDFRQLSYINSLWVGTTVEHH